MSHWLNLGEILLVNVKKYPDRIALKDARRSFTYKELNERVNRLANSFTNLGLGKGDKIAVLCENSIEIVELYLATAKTGVVAVPINFRLVASEIKYIINNSDASAVFVEEQFAKNIDCIRNELEGIPQNNFVIVGKNKTASYNKYDDLLSVSSCEEPSISVKPEDTWIILYTSGTTGTPKGVVRTHESYIAFYLINGIDFKFDENDICLNIMPLCHVNSTYFTLNVLYLGGLVYVHPASKFDPREILKIIEREKITFISLVPTHYQMILSIPESERKNYDVSSIKKLLCSSAPARKELKLGIMDFFKGVQLYEGYGSTEAGIVTVLKPEEQLKKLGSIGRESTGTSIIKILDENKKPLKKGEIGELYSRGPMLFIEYYKMPEKTKESFADEWFTARDMAYEDEEGYYYIVDRKDNMIITGGEKVFPTEVEKVICGHPSVYDSAVIGISDSKWGEIVTAIVVLKENCICSEDEIIEFCRDKVAGYKKPKKVIFIKDSEMPRTPTGKILHRELRKRFGQKI